MVIVERRKRIGIGFEEYIGGDVSRLTYRFDKKEAVKNKPVIAGKSMVAIFSGQRHL